MCVMFLKFSNLLHVLKEFSRERKIEPKWQLQVVYSKKNYVCLHNYLRGAAN